MERPTNTDRLRRRELCRPNTDKMKSRSTHNRKEEEEDNSGDSNTVTTKPTSRALLALLPFNKPGNVEGTTKTTGCGRGNNDSGGVADSTSRNRRSGRDKNAASGVNVGVGRVGDGAVGDDRRDFRSDRRKFVLRGKQKGGGSGLNSISQRSGKDTNTGRGGVSKSASRSKQRGLDGTDTNTSRGGVLNLATRSTRSGRETTTTTTRRHHGSNVEWSPSSSSSSSSSSKSSKGLYYLFTSSNGDDDDDDDDYVDKRGKKRQSGTKKDGRMKKKGGKTEAVESPEVLKAAEFPLTLRDSKKKQKNDDRKKAAVRELLFCNTVADMAICDRISLLTIHLYFIFYRICLLLAIFFFRNAITGRRSSSFLVTMKPYRVAKTIRLRTMIIVFVLLFGLKLS